MILIFTGRKNNFPVEKAIVRNKNARILINLDTNKKLPNEICIADRYVWRTFL